jgi:hypothetical protein
MLSKLAPKFLYAVVDKHGDVRHTFVSETLADQAADEPRYHGGSLSDEPWHVERYEIQPPLPSKKRRRR